MEDLGRYVVNAQQAFKRHSEARNILSQTYANLEAKQLSLSKATASGGKADDLLKIQNEVDKRSCIVDSSKLRFEETARQLLFDIENCKVLFVSDLQVAIANFVNIHSIRCSKSLKELTDIVLVNRDIVAPSSVPETEIPDDSAIVLAKKYSYKISLMDISISDDYFDSYVS